MCKYFTSSLWLKHIPRLEETKVWAVVTVDFTFDYYIMLQILYKYGTEWTMEIRDITDFVHQQHALVLTNQLDKLLVAEERVYPVTDQATASQIRLSSE